MNTFKMFLLICAVVLGTISCGSKTGNRDASELFPFPPTRPTDIGVVSQTKIGYMNREGLLVIEQRFDWADYFYEGLAQVKSGDKYGYIDKSGKYVINPQFENADSFSEGLALVGVGGKSGYFGGKFGYVDKSGKYAIEPQYSKAGPFSEGLASVEIGDKCGFIDKTGKIVIAPQFKCSADYGVFEPLDKFSEGLARVNVENKWGFIDKTGKFVIAPRFDNPYDFSEGLAAVGFNFKPGEAKSYDELPIDEPVRTDRPVVWGFIDKTGTLVIKLRFAMVASFSNGLAAVSIGDQFNCGYIDKSGKLVIGGRLFVCESFSNGIALVVRKKGEESYESLIIDTSGKIVHPRGSGSLRNDIK